MTKYLLLKDLEGKSPKIFGIPTGTKLDEMFYKVELDGEKWVRKPLGGLPHLSVINITGIPDTGKSLLAEQFAVTQAAFGYKVLFVTVESPANFLYSALKQKAEVLGANFSEIEENIIVIDASEEEELRENLKALLDTMAYAIKEKRATNVIIDSITGLYEHKEMMARQIVRQIFNFLKKWKQNAILISQKRSAQASESAEAAGGLAVAHIVDGTIVMDKKLMETQRDTNLYGLPLGSVLRTIRIDGCRLTAHDSRTWVFEITELGTIEIIAPLAEYIKNIKKR
ncbi:MAG: KaiC domain-containing protein [Candidatus Altiarchaeales archaeon]|nr:MAG: KaiC domain-containing protein [Candidatus Altiarchaeales archaeon]